MSKITFALMHYLALVIFLFSAWGIGISFLRKELHEPSKLNELLDSISLVLGIGIFVFGLQLLAITGHFNKNYILGLLLSGILLATRRLLLDLQSIKTRFKLQRGGRFLSEQKLLLLLIIIIGLPLLIKPLRPPLSWDELMYHLPHAKQWAQAGYLTVNSWIRYPWFPYNYELLYSASMILFDDVMPHLLHSLAGWLTAYMIFKLASKHYGFLTATISTIIWLILSINHYNDAYIDLAVTMFIFAAVISFYFWLENSKYTSLLLISAFLTGLAIGSKYQALMFLPFFGAAFLYKEKNPIKALLAVLFLLIPCIYWYARNYILTGDPINPIGGKLFGFSDWNTGDFEYQFNAFTPEKRGWPSWIILPALFTIITKDLRSSLIGKYLFAFGLSSTLIWLYISHYPRYLLPAEPALAILAASGWVYICMKIKILKSLTSNRNFKITILLTTLILLSIDSSIKIVSASKYIVPKKDAKETLLSKKVTGYKTISYSNINYPGKTYQFGLESSIYYFNSEVWGDHFGPGRYRDFSDLTSKKLHERLRLLNIQNLIINEDRWPNINLKPDFLCFFSVLYHEDINKSRIVLYRLNKQPECK